jgi:hypothetical protein
MAFFIVTVVKTSNPAFSFMLVHCQTFYLWQLLLREGKERKEEWGTVLLSEESAHKEKGDVT